MVLRFIFYKSFSIVISNTSFGGVNGPSIVSVKRTVEPPSFAAADIIMPPSRVPLAFKNSLNPGKVSKLLPHIPIV